MAKPIPLELPTRDRRAELLHELERAPMQHVEALLDTYQLLQALHDHGMLDSLRGALGSSDKILQVIVDATKTPEGIRALRNLVVLAKIAGAVEPEFLGTVAKSLSSNLAHAKSSEPLSLWQLFKKLRSRDSRRALTAMTSVLESVGKGLDQPPKE
jgi:uncharacterized protein YjgD (DUF1641 family)